MRNRAKPAVVALLCGLALCALQAQEQPSETASPTRQDASGKRGRKSGRSLSSDDRLSLIAAALDSRTRRYSEHDCSHLVHAIYERAGFPYQYASSDDLYAGTEAFQRVKRPESGDLVVWHGHVGIVIRPSRHVFFSFLSTGPGIDDYTAPYWKSRGRPRFYRYVKDDSCQRCVPVRSVSTNSR